MLRIVGLQKSYGNKLLFENATYSFPEGEKIALFGANGAGKTTLIKIISGIEMPGGGEIIKSSNLVLGYLPQIPNQNPAPTVEEECMDGAFKLKNLKNIMHETLEAMQLNHTEAALNAYGKAETEFTNAGGHALLSKARAILMGLGFYEEDFLKNPRTLSSGWRMRLELARLFLNDPDFLMLDEPTNHLDLPSLVWVERYLQSFKGTLLFVSHDRALLNRLSTITLHLYDGRLTPYSGNFEFFLQARDVRVNQELATLRQLRKKREHMEEFVEKFGVKATKARQAQSRMKMIEKIKEQESELEPEKHEASIAIKVPEPLRSGRELARVQKGVLGYERPLCEPMDLVIERGFKVAVIGANGIGKSTLLKTVSKKIQPLGGEFILNETTRIAYFAQDHVENLKTEKNVLDNLMMSAASELTEREARTLLGGFLFNGDDVYKSVSVLSGGELSRLSLACALAKKANLLMLDEPTNHLDISSREILINTLRQYAGTILFVSHDRDFIDGICTHVFAMVPGGSSMVFEGNLDDYARLSQVAGFPNVLDLECPKDFSRKNYDGLDQKFSQSRIDREEAKQLERSQRKRNREITEIEGRITFLQSEAEKLEEQLVNASTGDYKKALDLNKKLSEIRSEMATLEERWLVLTVEEK